MLKIRVLSMSLLACCVWAASMAAQNQGLAVAFPRETIAYGEYHITADMRSLLSEESLIEAGINKEDIDEMFRTAAEEIIQPNVLRGASPEDVRGIATQLNSVAFGALDWQMSGVENGIPAVFMLAMDHSYAGRLGQLLMQEVAEGNPIIMRGPEAAGAMTFEFTAPEGMDGAGPPGMPGEAMERVSSMVGVMAIVQGRYVLFSNSVTELLNGVERLQGGWEDYRLVDRSDFIEVAGEIQPTTVSRSYLSLRELVKHGSLFGPAADVMHKLEIHKLRAIGGFSTWDVDGQQSGGETSLLMRSDDVPTWYSIIQHPPKVPTLMAVTRDDAFMTMWSGMDNMLERGESLVEFFTNALSDYSDDIERMGKQGMKALEKMPIPGRGEEPGTPDDGMPEDGMPEDMPEDRDGDGEDDGMDEDADEDMEAEIRALVGLLGGQQLISMGSLNPNEPQFVAAATLKPGTTNEQVIDIVAQFTEMGVVEAIESMNGFDRYVIEDQFQLALGHDILIAGTPMSVEESIELWQANQGRDYSQYAASGVMMLDYSSMKQMMEDMPSPMEQMPGPMGGMPEEFFSEMMEMTMNLKLIMNGRMLGNRYVLESKALNLPGRDQYRRMIGMAVQAFKQQKSRDALSGIHNAISFSEFETEDGLRATSLEQLVELGLLSAEELKDPMDPNQDPEVSSFTLAPVPAAAMSNERFLLAYQNGGWLNENKRLAVLLNGEIVALSEEEFTEALAAAEAGKVLPPKKARTGEVPSEKY